MKRMINLSSSAVAVALFLGTPAFAQHGHSMGVKRESFIQQSRDQLCQG